MLKIPPRGKAPATGDASRGKQRRSRPGAAATRPVSATREVDFGESRHVQPTTVESFLEGIRPLAERIAQTWPGIPERSRRRFLHELTNVLGQWFQKAHLEVSKSSSEEFKELAVDLLQNVKNKAIALVCVLEEITKPYPFKGPTDMSAYRLVQGNLLDAIQARTPSWDIDGIRAALLAMAAAADNPTVKRRLLDGSVVLTPLAAIGLPTPAPKHRKRRQGRPAGFDRYPGLDFLVFELGVVMARVGVNLTAYIKDGGEVKVAAGSLIQILDMLRRCVRDQGLVNPMLPFPDQHRRYVATYQRLLARADSHVVRSGRSGRKRYSSKLRVSGF